MKFSSRLRELRRKIKTVSREEDEVENRIKSRRGRSAVREERQIEDQIIELEESLIKDVLSSDGVDSLESFVEWEEFLAQKYGKLIEAVIRGEEYLDSNPSVAESEVKKAERIATDIERKRTKKREEMSEDTEDIVKSLQIRDQLLESISELENVVQRLKTEEEVMREPVQDSKFEEVENNIEDIGKLRSKIMELKERQEEVEDRFSEVNGRINISNKLQSLKNSVKSDLRPDIERVKRIIESLQEIPEHTDEMVAEVAELTQNTCGFKDEEMEINELTMVTVDEAEQSGDEIRMRAETRKCSEMGVQEQVVISVYVQNRTDEKHHGTVGVKLPEGWTVTGILDADIATPRIGAKRFVLEPGQKQVIKIAAWQYGDSGKTFEMFTTHHTRSPEVTKKKFRKYPLPQSEDAVDYHERIEVIGEGKSEMPEEKVGLTARGTTNATEPKTYSLEMEAENHTDETQPVKLVVEAPDGWRFNGAEGFDDASPDTMVVDERLGPGESINPAVSLWKHSLKDSKMRIEMTRKKDNRKSAITKSLP